MRSGEEFKEKPKQEKSWERIERLAKEQGIKIRTVKGDGKITVVFKPKKRGSI
jgi:hypothetical protein